MSGYNTRRTRKKAKDGKAEVILQMSPDFAEAFKLGPPGTELWANYTETDELTRAPFKRINLVGWIPRGIIIIASTSKSDQWRERHPEAIDWHNYTGN